MPPQCSMEIILIGYHSEIPRVHRLTASIIFVCLCREIIWNSVNITHCGHFRNCLTGLTHSMKMLFRMLILVWCECVCVCVTKNMMTIIEWGCMCVCVCVWYILHVIEVSMVLLKAQSAHMKWNWNWNCLSDVCVCVFVLIPYGTKTIHVCHG